MQRNKRFAVFWFDPEPTAGAELRKIRPCVVVSPEIMDKALHTVLVAPLTSTIKSWPFRTVVTVNGQQSSAACDQIRAVNKSRLKEYISTLTSSESRAVLRILQALFAE